MFQARPAKSRGDPAPSRQAQRCTQRCAPEARLVAKRADAATLAERRAGLVEPAHEAHFTG
ncbi:hypothetical protein A7982_12373 [Minicystis rosea]|nr:hypothetical protein A7982_12373 [Minicystis rosea]